jgi:hypothetical protein
MNIFQWILEVFLAVLWLYSLYAVLNPAKTVKFTIDRNMKAMKFYGFKASIKPTKKSAGLIQKGHVLVLVLLTIYMAAIYLYGNAFMRQLIR